ncbi:MAG: hypothetical protein ACRDP2_05790, partial [Nocardioidaceae bacterium]
MSELAVARHRFHGDPERFDVLASFVADRYGRTVHHIADVVGGQGMLSRVATDPAAPSTIVSIPKSATPAEARATAPSTSAWATPTPAPTPGRP